MSSAVGGWRGGCPRGRAAPPSAAPCSVVWGVVASGGRLPPGSTGRATAARCMGWCHRRRRLSHPARPHASPCPVVWGVVAGGVGCPARSGPTRRRATLHEVSSELHASGAPDLVHRPPPDQPRAFDPRPPGHHRRPLYGVLSELARRDASARSTGRRLASRRGSPPTRQGVTVARCMGCCPSFARWAPRAWCTGLRLISRARLIPTTRTPPCHVA